MTPRLAPHSVESEDALLGSLFIDPSRLDVVKPLVTPNDFFLIKNGVVYQAMLDVAAVKDPIDLVTVSDRLEACGKLESVGGHAAVARYLGTVPTSVNAEFYARHIAMKAQRRALLSYVDDVRELAYDEVRTTDDVLAEADRRLRVVTDRRTSLYRARSVEDIVQAQYDLIEQATESGNYTPERFPLHVAALHNIVRGFRPQTVATFAARPGVGKSSYLHNEAAFIAECLKDGRRVLLYSLEMPELQVVDALVAGRARLNVSAISERRMRPDHLKQYSRAAGDIARFPLDIDDQTRHWEDMAAEIRARQRAGTLSVVFIDYLGLIKTREKFNGDGAVRRRIDFVLAEAKSLAMETGGVIVFAAQFNRQGDGAPSLVHLKESGGIEEHSDLVIGIDRDMSEATVYSDAVQPARLIVLKHRHGPLGTADAGYYGAYKRFVDLKRTGANEHAAD